MKINGTELISEILYRHNTFIRSANNAGLLTCTDILSEVLEYAKVIRVIMAAINASADTLIDYDNLFKKLEERQNALDAEANTKEIDGQAMAWNSSIVELIAMKARMHGDKEE